MEEETFLFFERLCTSLLRHTVTQLLIFLKATIGGLQVGEPGVGEDVVECESCHGTQSTYHAKSRRECSSGPGRPSIPGKLIVINQVTETEQGLADNHLFPLLLLLPPPLPSASSSILHHVSWCSFHPEEQILVSNYKQTLWDVNASKTCGHRCTINSS